MKKSSLSESSSDMMDLEDGVESTPGLLSTTGGGGGGVGAGGRITASGALGGGGAGAAVMGLCGSGGAQDSMGGGCAAGNGSVVVVTSVGGVNQTALTMAADPQSRVAHPYNNDKQQQQQQTRCKPQSSTCINAGPQQRHNSALAVSIETDV